MRFERSIVSLLLVTLSAVPAFASRLEEEQANIPQSDGLRIVDITKTPQGTLVWYGMTQDAATRSNVNRSHTEIPGIETHGRNECGTNRPILCDENNQAGKNACLKLQQMFELSPMEAVSDFAQSVCTTSGKQSCCTSWPDRIPGLTLGMLHSGLFNAIASCNPGNHMISAKVLNVELGGICTSQCISNRHDQC